MVITRDNNMVRTRARTLAGWRAPGTIKIIY